MRHREFLAEEGLEAIESWIDEPDQDDPWICLGFALQGAGAEHYRIMGCGEAKDSDVQGVIARAAAIRSHLADFIDAAEKALRESPPPAVAERGARERSEL